VRYRLLSIPLGLALGAGFALALGWMPLGRPAHYSQAAVLAAGPAAGESEEIRPAIISPHMLPIEHEVLPAVQQDFAVPRTAFERGLVEDGEWTPAPWGDPWYVPPDRRADARIESAGTVGDTGASAPAGFDRAQPESPTYAGLERPSPGEPPHPFSPRSEARSGRPAAPAEPFVVAPEPGDTRPWYVYPHGDEVSFGPDWKAERSGAEQKLTPNREE